MQASLSSGFFFGKKMVIKLSQCLAVHDKQTSNTLTVNENIVLIAANYTLTGI